MSTNVKRAKVIELVTEESVHFLRGKFIPIRTSQTRSVHHPFSCTIPIHPSLLWSPGRSPNTFFIPQSSLAKPPMFVARVFKKQQTKTLTPLSTTTRRSDMGESTQQLVIAGYLDNKTAKKWLDVAKGLLNNNSVLRRRWYCHRSNE